MLDLTHPKYYRQLKPASSTKHEHPKGVYTMHLFIANLIALAALAFVLGGCGSSDNLMSAPLPVPAASPIPVQGPEGPLGPIGTQGVQGDTGPQGLQGIPGTNGLDGTLADFIKFCPNDVPVYPSVFPEYGIRVGTAVYAVYSANGGFLALLPPGAYASNAIGSSCSFVLNEDGSLSW